MLESTEKKEKGSPLSPNNRSEGKKRDFSDSLRESSSITHKHSEKSLSKSKKIPKHVDLKSEYTNSLILHIVLKYLLIFKEKNKCIIQ